MSGPTAATRRLRTTLSQQRDRVAAALRRYGAENPRLFGSVATGEATEQSDLDILVDLVPGAGNELLRVAGLSEELSEVLGVRVDVVTAALLRDAVSATVQAGRGRRVSRSQADRLQDIRSAILRCIAYRDHLDSAEFGSMTNDAVLRNLAVVGEAEGR